MSSSDNELVMRIGNSTRVEESQIRQYKWASEKEEHEAFMYSNIINFKRSSNPRGHAHHCVMCGDRKAAIPSQNKDVCKTCDSGYWLVESVQVVVKFCKGCKNFTRLHDFRDKPEATKCIKCRQRGRQNYFAKKGRGDVISLLPPNAKIGGEGELDHTPLIRPLVQQPRSDYDFYPEEGPALGGPRLTSSRQVALQKNRMSKSRGVPTNPKSRNGGARGDRYANTQYIITDPAMEAMHRPLDHERANSFSSLLGGSYLPGDDGELLLGDDDDIAGNDTGSRSRSDTLLSISSVGLAGLGESLGIISTGKGKTSGRMRRGSEEWDMLASSQYTALLSQDPFDNDLPSAFSLNDVPGQWSQKGKGLRGSSEEESQSTRKRRMSFDAQSGNGNTTTPSNGSSGQEPRGKQISSLFGSGNKNELDSNGNGDSFGAIEEVSVEPELRRSRRDTVELLQSTFGQ